MENLADRVMNALKSRADATGGVRGNCRDLVEPLGGDIFPGDIHALLNQLNTRGRFSSYYIEGTGDFSLQLHSDEV